MPINLIADIPATPPAFPKIDEFDEKTFVGGELFYPAMDMCFDEIADMYQF